MSDRKLKEEQSGEVGNEGRPLSSSRRRRRGGRIRQSKPERSVEQRAGH